MNSQENEYLDHQTNQPRILTNYTNDQDQIIVLQTYYSICRTLMMGKMEGKGGRGQEVQS